MDKIDKNAFAERLKKFLLEEFGYIAEAARRMGIPEGTLRYAYLNGKSLPGSEMILELIKCNCDIYWLLTGEATEKAQLSFELLEVINNNKKVLNYIHEQDLHLRKIAPLIQKFEEKHQL